MSAVHTNLELCKKVALVKSVETKTKLTIIILNPNENGEFDFVAGSTYEIVTNSYFEKQRNNIKIITDTNQLWNKQKINSQKS